jgi:hypothetical protein
MWQLAWPLIVAELGWMLTGRGGPDDGGPAGRRRFAQLAQDSNQRVCLSLALTPVVVVALWATIPLDPPTDSIFAFAFLLVILDR